MGIVVSQESYTENQIKVSKLAKAISHPARIAIIELLNKKDCSCNDIVSTLPLAQSTVSQHLNELKKVGLINGISLTPKTIYHLNKDMYLKSRRLINSFFSN